MLQTKMAPSSAVLRPYVWPYGTTGRVDSLPLVIPLPARPKQLLTSYTPKRVLLPLDVETIQQREGALGPSRP
jgi:hypothetical protein